MADIIATILAFALVIALATVAHAGPSRTPCHAHAAHTHCHR